VGAAEVVGIAHQILRLFEGEKVAVEEPWARDETRFEEHFGAPYEAFVTRIPLLSADQAVRYAATLKVNPEAAVLWVLSMSDV
jgi:hypothetical protein